MIVDKSDTQCALNFRSMLHHKSDPELLVVIVKIEQKNIYDKNKMFYSQMRQKVNNNSRLVWHKKKDGSTEKNLICSVKSDGGSVMMWSCFPCKGPKNLVRLNRLHVFKLKGYNFLWLMIQAYIQNLTEIVH